MTVQEAKAKEVLNNIWDFADAQDEEKGDVVDDAIIEAIGCMKEVEQYRALGTVEELKEAREKQPKTDWISVEETLPESYEYVLVWCKGNFVGGTHEGEETEWYGIGILCNDRWSIYQCKDIKNAEVIAWSFMPQPYKKEGAE